MTTTLFQAVARLAPGDPRADAQLVRAFLADADQAAFAELVRRHGPAVLGVCRRFLGPTPDAEDAFQATFLVLVRRARSTAWRESLGPWLYGVALKVARKARAARARRLTNERPGGAMSEPALVPPEPDDAGPVLDEELAALPALYRLPLVLCELQGASRRDAARELGLTEGTLSSRLARGRKLLRARLAARGVVPVTAGLAVAVPAGLAGATVRNAVHVLTRTAGAVPAGVLFLTDGVTKTMFAKWKLTGVLVACAALTGFGAWRTEAQPTPTPTPGAKSAPAERATAKPDAPKTEKGAPTDPERVATIFGDVPVTKDAFAEHLIRRYGKKELELFVNKQIIATAFGKKEFRLTAADMQAALDEDCKALSMTREQFFRDVLPRYNKTPEEWTEDVVTPRLMLSQLLKAKLPPVTEAELRGAFDARFGERLNCRVIFWNKGQEDEARRAHKAIGTDAEVFDRFARNSTDPNLATTGGAIKPLPRNPKPGARAEQVIASKLQAGEISPLVVTDTGFVLLYCCAVIPADKKASFDAHKAALLAELVQERIERTIPELFNELKQQANPKYHLTLPEPRAEQGAPGAKAAPAQPAAGPKRVATIFGDVPVTKDAFAEHLIRRYGKKELELFVNKQIIATAFARQGLTLSPDEVRAALDESCVVTGLTREQLGAEILKNTGKSLEEWNEDMNVPAIMLARLAKGKVAAPTGAELRQAFDRRYGEKLDCRLITWVDEKEARAAYEKVRESEAEFDAHARRCPQAGLPRSGVAADGRVGLMPRAAPLDDNTAERAVSAAVAKLQAGEVSALTRIDHEGQRGWLVAKCDRVIPADKTKSFENERAVLLDDVMKAKIGNEVKKLSVQVMKDGNPKYHLTFPEPQARPTPVPPAKK